MSTDQSTDPTDPTPGPLVLVVPPDGPATAERMPVAGTMAEDQAQLRFIQETVGGCFTTIGDGFWLALVNEDGDRLGLPVNTAGNLLARALGFRFRPGDMMLGPVIFTSRIGVELGDCPATVMEVARQAGVLA